MKQIIGFQAAENYLQQGECTELPCPAADTAQTVKPALAEVQFESCHRTLSYYNDRFPLQVGDTVFVEGKLAGCRGKVVSLCYNFKIKLSDYKRIIGVANTDVHGQFYMMGPVMLSFDAAALPYEKAASWFLPPADPDEEIVCGSDAQSFLLADTAAWNMPCAVLDRGLDYLTANRIAYLSLAGSEGRALVKGSEVYEVAFRYENGEISALTCSCFCSGACKHEAAALMLLRQLLQSIAQNYGEAYAASGFFAAVNKADFCCTLLAGKESGSLII